MTLSYYKIVKSQRQPSWPCPAHDLTYYFRQLHEETGKKAAEARTILSAGGEIESDRYIWYAKPIETPWVPQAPARTFKSRIERARRGRHLKPLGKPYMGP